MNRESDLNAKAASFLAALRGAPGAAGVPGAVGPGAAGLVSEEALRPLTGRLAELEKRLAAVEAAEGAEPAPEEPPKPPSELMIYLQTRMDLLERKLQTAQEEALRANLLLREREELQRRARGEVEDLFRLIREQARAGAWDARLREELASSRSRAGDLESRLSELERGRLAPEDILRAVNETEGREELERRLREMAARALDAGAPAAAGEPLARDPGEPPREPAGDRPTPPSGEAPSRPSAVGGPAGPRPADIALLLGRVADLEKRLHEAQQERDEERRRRALWEKDLLASVTAADDRWRRGGGARVVIEAALEALVGAVKDRDACVAEMDSLTRRCQVEPPGSSELPALRAKLAELHDRVAALQEQLARHMAVVQAWLQQGRQP